MSRHDVHPAQGSTARGRGSAGRLTGVLLMTLTLSSLVFLWPVAADPADSPPGDYAGHARHGVLPGR